MLIGIIIVIVGVCCLLENLGIDVDWGLVASLVLIGASVVVAIKNRKVTLWSIILFIIGAWTLLFKLNIVTVELGEIFWPIIIVLCGFAVILNKLKFFNKSKGGIVSKDEKLIYSGVFGGVEEKLADTKYKQIIINSVFGGVSLDLRELELKNDIQVEINSVFGGSDLILSDNYNVVVSNISIFGATDNKHITKFDKEKPTININCVNVFGGTDLK